MKLQWKTDPFDGTLGHFEVFRPPLLLYIPNKDINYKDYILTSDTYYGLQQKARNSLESNVFEFCGFNVENLESKDKICTIVRSSNHEENGVKDLLKPSNALLQSEKLLIEKLRVDKVSLLNHNIALPINEVDDFINVIKFLKFSLERYLLERAIRWGKVVDDALRLEGSAELREDLKKYLQNAQCYLSLISDKHLNCLLIVC
ncbi:hypothetical protein TNIN_417791 [Trichonephila inaurata madagascariensis]|uniref:Uncharacterized protein n=1 Tax=Trichonephila inaurata madagascariensis TaxID=2747483 RepID=A0A8X6XCN6_9ARAC|nr:hypothetical protein TNIN_417791 [Trichonephila inaurata madagascariensis]